MTTLMDRQHDGRGDVPIPREYLYTISSRVSYVLSRLAWLNLFKLGWQLPFQSPIV